MPSPRLVPHVLLSTFTHLAAVAGAVGAAAGWSTPEAPVRPFVPAEVFLEIEVLPSPPSAPGGRVLAAKERERVVIPRGGGDGVARADTGTPGKGGDREASEQAVNLADEILPFTRDTSVLSRLDRAQVPRIAVGTKRRSRDDWRASRHPTELTLLSTGAASTPRDRRPVDGYAAHGGTATGAPSTLGGPLGAQAEGEGITPRKEGADRPGSDRASSGLGSRDPSDRGSLRGDAAPRGDARPLVAVGTPSVPASESGKPSDTGYSEQEVSARMQAILHASTLGGARGKGAGGVPGAGAPASGGGAGTGSRSTALGTGAGQGVDPVTTARTMYLRTVLSKVHPHWQNAFPRWAVAKGLGGEVHVAFTISADGSVAGAPTVVRQSGITEFDEGCRVAVTKAGNFGPLPAVLGSSLRLTIPFVAKNPTVLPIDRHDGVSGN
jgi:TonB family protein